MNMIKLISVLLVAVIVVLPGSAIVDGSENIDSDGPEIRLNTTIATIKSTLAQAKSDEWTHPLDWTVYGDAFLYLFEHEEDVTFVYEMIDWLIRDTPLQHWETPEKAIRQFLMASRDKPDREGIRLKLLDLLVFKAPIPDFSTSKFTGFLFDSMPSIRRFMIQTLKEDGTKVAIPDFEKRIAELKSGPSPTESDLEEITVLKEAIENIRLLAERLETGWIPNEDEIKQQAETIIRKKPLAFGSGARLPGYMDGPNYIIDRWQKYKWGAELIIKSDEYHQGQKSLVRWHILPRVHDKDWDEAFPIIMHYYNNSNNPRIRGAVVGDILERNSVDDLHRLSYLLTSEDPADGIANAHLLRKYAEIGTEEHLPELRRSVEFWQERDNSGRVNSRKRAIEAIEQRFGIGSAEDKDSL